MEPAHPQASFPKLSAGLRRDDGRWVADVAGLTLQSRFQPIYSLSHRRAVGHEALLRATDATGQAVPPQVALRGDGSFADLLRGDRAARMVHGLNFAELAVPPHWLFFNMQPQVFIRLPVLEADGFQRELQARSGIKGHQVVLEVLEDAVPVDADFDRALLSARASGCLVALDDFGAGHSNLDRVWRLQPEIVKLDRSLVRRAALGEQARRVVTHMVALLHDCGALVLFEGIETPEEAFVALEANADLVQGDLFGTPMPTLVPADFSPQPLLDLWEGYERRREEERRRYHDRIRPYIGAIGSASVLLAEGRSLEEATAGFLKLPDSQVCFLLGDDGRQLGDGLWAPQSQYTEPPAFAPMHDTSGAQCARRPYYRRAMESPGRVQVTRPYRTMHGAHLCVTVSIAFRAGDRMRVVCGDLGWASDEADGGPDSSDESAGRR